MGTQWALAPARAPRHCPIWVPREGDLAHTGEGNIPGVSSTPPPPSRIECLLACCNENSGCTVLFRPRSWGRGCPPQARARRGQPAPSTPSSLSKATGAVHAFPHITQRRSIFSSSHFPEEKLEAGESLSNVPQMLEKEMRKLDSHSGIWVRRAHVPHPSQGLSLGGTPGAHQPPHPNIAQQLSATSLGVFLHAVCQHPWKLPREASVSGLQQADNEAQKSHTE